MVLNVKRELKLPTGLYSFGTSMIKNQLMIPPVGMQEIDLKLDNIRFNFIFKQRGNLDPECANYCPCFILSTFIR